MINNQMNELGEQLKISIIIPVYNIEKYLEECVNSVLNQSYRRIEVILINDGSSDDSLRVCKELAKKDSRIIIVDKKNGGASDARNFGIKMASGEYVMFLDGDDYWDDTDALRRLVKRLDTTKVDVLNFSYKKYFEDTGEKKPYFYNLPPMPLSLKDKYDQISYITGKGLYIASPCNKIIKRSLFKEDLFFSKGVSSEDIEWCAKIIVYAKSMDFICENFYCYRQRTDSTVHTIDEKKCKDLCDNIKKCFYILEHCEKNIEKSLKQYIAYQYGTFIKVQAQAKNNPCTIVQELEKYSDILYYHRANPKLITLNLGCKVLGFTRVCKIVRSIYNIRNKGAKK